MLIYQFCKSLLFIEINESLLNNFLEFYEKNTMIGKELMSV